MKADCSGFAGIRGLSGRIFQSMPSPFPPPASDTSPEAEAVQLHRLRELEPHAKARLVSELTATANHFALAGLRERFPRAGERELLLRLAALRLGDAVVREAYGWSADRNGA